MLTPTLTRPDALTPLSLDHEFWRHSAEAAALLIFCGFLSSIVAVFGSPWGPKKCRIHLPNFTLELGSV